MSLHNFVFNFVPSTKKGGPSYPVDLKDTQLTTCMPNFVTFYRIDSEIYVVKVAIFFHFQAFNSKTIQPIPMKIGMHLHRT